MKTLFINGSPNKNGNTAHLAATLLAGRDYETLNLVDYKLYSYGQSFPGDQFQEILAKMKEADTIVIGSPVYWHNLCGAVRNLLDRFYGPVSGGRPCRPEVCLFVPRGRPGEVDAGKCRIHHGPLRPHVRHGVIGYGFQRQRSGKAAKEAVTSMEKACKRPFPFPP